MAYVLFSLKLSEAKSKEIKRANIELLFGKLNLK